MLRCPGCSCWLLGGQREHFQLWEVECEKGVDAGAQGQDGGNEEEKERRREGTRMRTSESDSDTMTLYRDAQDARNKEELEQDDENKDEKRE